jgi:hypothetical protein
MLRRVALVRTDVSKEHIATIIKVRRICCLRNFLWLLVTANVVPSSPILVTLMMEAIRSSEASVLIAATRRNFPEYAILTSFVFHASEGGLLTNLFCYINFFPI